MKYFIFILVSSLFNVTGLGYAFFHKVFEGRDLEYYYDSKSYSDSDQERHYPDQIHL